MAEPVDRTIVRPHPQAVQVPAGVPRYIVERNQSVDEWCQNAQRAIQDLQKKVKAQAADIEILKNA